MLSIWYWALQRTAQYFSKIYTLMHSYSIHIFVLVRRYKNVENSRMNHNDLKIVWTSIHRSLFKKLLHHGEPSSHFPFPFFGLTCPKGRSAVTDCLNANHRNMHMDWGRLSSTIMRHFSFFFLFFCTSSSHRLLYLSMVRTLSYSGLLRYTTFIFLYAYSKLNFTLEIIPRLF